MTELSVALAAQLEPVDRRGEEHAAELQRQDSAIVLTTRTVEEGRAAIALLKPPAEAIAADLRALAAEESEKQQEERGEADLPEHLHKKMVVE